MKALSEQVKGLMAIGYRRLPAQAKVAHDVLLMAMHRSGCKESSSIKGGVVMSQITSDIRRATMDLRTKMDIGVHIHDELVQVDCVFDLSGGEASVELQANSNEQIFAEKLASLVRHGILSQRPKDVYDMYYLSERIDITAFRKCVEVLVYESKRCQVANKDELIRLVRKVFMSKRFIGKLKAARVNWLEIDPSDAMEGVLAVLEAL